MDSFTWALQSSWEVERIMAHRCSELISLVEILKGADLILSYSDILESSHVLDCMVELSREASSSCQCL